MTAELGQTGTPQSEKASGWPSGNLACCPAIETRASSSICFRLVAEPIPLRVLECSWNSTASARTTQVIRALTGSDPRLPPCKPDTRLPPTRELARELELSRAIVPAAYEQLRAEGFIEGRIGSGTCVVLLQIGHCNVSTERPKPSEGHRGSSTTPIYRGAREGIALRSDPLVANVELACKKDG